MEECTGTSIMLVCIWLIRSISGLNGQDLHSGSHMERKEMELFLNMHLENCLFISLCTYKEVTEAPVSQNERSCCHACSCRADCGKLGNCCPDYEVYTTFGNVTFDNVTEVVDAMDAIGMFTLQNGTYVEPNSTHGAEDVKTTCIRSQLMNNIDVPPGFGYQMVTSCPTEIPLASAMERNHQVPWNILYYNVPVYSHIDKRTYKNKFCMKQHSQNLTHARQWQVILRCKAMTFSLNRYYRFPSDIMKDVLSGETPTSDCNVVYEPEKTMAFKSCTAVDVTSCQSSGKLRNMCRRHFLPVDRKRENQIITFKNSACLKCSNKFTSNAACRDQGGDSYFVLNLPQNEERNNNSNELDVQFDTIGNCKRGYVFDEELLECRLVLCPRLMYSLVGSCVPVFRRLTPVYYTIMINASIDVNKIRTIDVDNMKVFIDTMETSLIRTLRSVFRNDLRLDNFDFDLYQKPSTNNQIGPDCYFINLKFWQFNLNGSYSWAQRKANLLLTEYSEKTLNTVYGNIYVYLTLSSTVQMKPNSVFELTSLKYLVLRYSLHRLKLHGQEVPLSASSFCYRIALKYNELRFLRTLFTVTRTGKNIYPVDFDNLADTKAPLVCLGTLFPHLIRDEILTNNKISNTERVPKPNEQFVVRNETVIGFSVLASVIGTLLIILVLKRILKRQ